MNWRSPNRSLVMPILTADIGGTQIKLGVAEGGRLRACDSIAAQRAAGLATALSRMEETWRRLCESCSIEPRHCAASAWPFPGSSTRQRGTSSRRRRESSTMPDRWMFAAGPVNSSACPWRSAMTPTQPWRVNPSRNPIAPRSPRMDALGKGLRRRGGVRQPGRHVGDGLFGRAGSRSRQALLFKARPSIMKSLLLALSCVLTAATAHAATLGDWQAGP